MATLSIERNVIVVAVAPIGCRAAGTSVRYLSLHAERGNL